MTNSIAVNIKNLRKERNMTRKLLSELLEVKITTVGEWERGISEPTNEQIEQLAQALDVEEKDITGVNSGERFENSSRTSRHKEDSVRIHNIWEFLAEYWWSVVAIIGAIGWSVSMILDSWPK